MGPPPPSPWMGLPGIELLRGAVDCHVHATPHINPRSVDVFQAVRQAHEAGLAGLGLMDNFANSAGYAALAMRELGHLGVDVFGGLIMQPTAGGISADAVRTALAYGYGAGGARFISLPTHHTRHVALQEGRGGLYLESCFAVPERGAIPDPVPEIMAVCAAADAVFDCGHVSGPEAVRLAEAARAAGCTRVRTHCTGYAVDAIQALVAVGAHAEFSFFTLSHATQVALTHADAEAHRIESHTIVDVAPRIRAAGERAILSSDAGVALLPPPVEAFREFLLLVRSAGFDHDAIRRMVVDAPRALFRIS